MIDLHLHTTASDGRLSPADLVARVASARITVMSVTDHDTVAGLAEARHASTAAGVRLIDGIEVTSVDEGRDVHVLGYYIDPSDRTLEEFLLTQRARRVARVREIGARLADLGVPVDVTGLLARAAHRPGTSVGRPVLARALVEREHASSMQEAFDRYLAVGQPAFVPRIGPTPREVVDIIHRAGGLASMAHPGVTQRPHLMGRLAREGLDAIEVYHSDHSPDLQRELLAFARRRNLLVTGGSDFHGDDQRCRPLGRMTLPAEDFQRLQAARA